VTTPRDEIRSLVGKFTSDLEGLVRTAALAAVQNALGSAASKAVLDKQSRTVALKSMPVAKVPNAKLVASANTTTKRVPAAKPTKASKPVKVMSAKPAKSTKPAKAGKVAKAAKSGGKAAKRIRRSDDQIDLMANAIHDYVVAHPGSGAEQIKTSLKISKAQWLLPIKRLQDQGRLLARGEKRNTTYTSARSPSKR
jgi:hypothetical protein